MTSMLHCRLVSLGSLWKTLQHSTTGSMQMFASLISLAFVPR